jgi:phosphonate transport system permease protein
VVYQPTGEKTQHRLKPAHTGVKSQAPWLVVRAVLAVPRAIHELIWGLFFVNIFGLDPLVAILAIAIPFVLLLPSLLRDFRRNAPSTLDGTPQ